MFAASATVAHCWVLRTAAAEAGCAESDGKKRGSGHNAGFQANGVAHQFVKSAFDTTQV